ncbi:tetrahydrofolate dehydrogenase/cyclohydrolase catalytic domain-containing protein [Anaerofustis sp.]|uniref:bifunctional 5,10-methylenetetrahydrofolate dehydrogenase/5,10-methenyltetrahydrofolate cyclohydrolase n=1 Tax=Anaerofustis sp. TaxID=1872517 RepID=UPI0025BFFD59|nr:tetrahydrofolate dehydrogenase/cyclohydrolase catalytic domain-containing protein [Anaerofustis sp.]
MKAKLLGKNVTEKIISDCKIECENIKQKGIIPTLAVMRVGNNKSDISYEKNIIKLMDKAGISVKSIILDQNVSKDSFTEKLQELNKDENVNSILIFRPLPSHINEDKIKYIIDPKKDIDCFSPLNLAKVFISDESGFYPCTPLGVMEMLDYYKIELTGKNVVIVGRSLVVGKPLSMMLLDRHATVTICHSKTDNLQKICKKADILIVAIGRGNMIDKNYIKEGATVIDVGINFIDGKMTGDVSIDSALEVTEMITPVPGGVGGVTTACLIKNVLKSCKNTH